VVRAELSEARLHEARSASTDNEPNLYRSVGQAVLPRIECSLYWRTLVRSLDVEGSQRYNISDKRKDVKRTVCVYCCVFVPKMPNRFSHWRTK
jgi:hypothetical protein